MRCRLPREVWKNAAAFDIYYAVCSAWGGREREGERESHCQKERERCCRPSTRCQCIIFLEFFAPRALHCFREKLSVNNLLRNLYRWQP